MIFTNRHRKKGGGNVTLQTSAWDIDPPGPMGLLDPATYEDSFQTIDDVYEPYGDGNWSFKPVIMQNFCMTPQSWGSGTSGHRRSDGTMRLGGYTNKFNWIANCFAVHSGRQITSGSIFPIDSGIPADIRSRMANSWANDLSPKIKAELDLLVSLLEFGEVIDLVKSAKTLAVKVWRFNNAHASLQKRLAADIKWMVSLSKDTLNLDAVEAFNAATLKGSDALLQYVFGIRPLVSDLIGIANGILRFRKKLEDLLAGQGKSHTVHATFYGDSPFVDFSGGSTCNRCNNCIFPSREKRNYPYRVEYPNKTAVKYGLTVKYRYSMPAWFSGIEGGIRALFSTLGLSPGVDTIWERIPFSFIVDWFLPIGPLLAKWQVDPTPVRCDIIDVVVSKKLGAQALLSAGWVDGCYEPLQPLARMEYAFYARTVDPSVLDMALPTFRWPSLFQLILGAALGRQGFRKWGHGA